MKKIVSLLFALTLIVMPLTSALANPMATTSNTAYVYLFPMGDGNVGVKEKHYGTIEVGQEFTLPEGAENITTVSGELTENNTIVAVEPPAPEEGAEPTSPYIEVEYTINLVEGQLTFTSQQDAESIIFFMPQDLGLMSSPDGTLQPSAEPFAIEETVYNVLLTPAPLEKGTDVTVAVSSDGSASTSESTGEVSKTSSSPMSPQHVRLWNESPLGDLNPHVVTAVLVALVVAGVGFYIFVRIKDRKREAAKIEVNEEEFMELVESRRIILAKITELEALYEKGEVDEENYLAKDRAYREQLTKVFLQLKHYTD